MRAFLDTNLFFYSFDPRDAAKQARAKQLVADFMVLPDRFTSVQVAQELANGLLRKLKPGFTPDAVRAVLDTWEASRVISLDLSDVASGLALTTSASLSFWDALILIAAEKAECDVLFSEDLQAGQIIRGVRIVNPFQAEEGS